MSDGDEAERSSVEWNGLKLVFVTQKQHGEFKTETEKRFGEVETEVATIKEGQKTTKELLILIAVSVLGTLLLSVVHLFR